LAAWFSGDLRVTESAYWATVTAHAGPVFAVSSDAPKPCAPATLVRELSAGETRALSTTSIAGTGIHDLLLAALGRALCVEARRSTVLVDVEGHGRAALDGVDLSRSVGWFTTLYPVALACGTADDRAAWIDAAKRAIRAIPHGGIGFGLLQPGDAAAADHADVSFNFLGTLEAGTANGLVRGLAPESAGALVADDMPRRYRLDCNAAVIDGRLVMQYAYDEAVLSEATIAAVADHALATLRASIADDDVDALLDELDLSELGQ
jgi:non-ribosomal peptide synthase protein (TIGR01720 family)